MTDVLSSDGPSQFLRYSERLGSELDQLNFYEEQRPASRAAAAAAAATLAAMMGSRRRANRADNASMTRNCVRKITGLAAPRGPRLAPQRSETAALRLPSWLFSPERRAPYSTSHSSPSTLGLLFQGASLTNGTYYSHLCDVAEPFAAPSGENAWMAIASEPPEGPSSAGAGTRADGDERDAEHESPAASADARHAAVAGRSQDPPPDSDFWFPSGGSDCGWLDFYLNRPPLNIARYCEFSELFQQENSLPLPSELEFELGLGSAAF